MDQEAQAGFLILKAWEKIDADDGGPGSINGPVAQGGDEERPAMPSKQATAKAASVHLLSTIFQNNSRIAMAIPEQAAGATSSGELDGYRRSCAIPTDDQRRIGI